ncbi:MAG: short chain dehydrogenase [Bacteroidota bacterium]
MRILIIGGHGTIGRVVATHYAEQHEVIIAGRSAEIKVDIADSQSIKSMLERVGPLDAIICAAGEARWAPFADLSEEDYYIGLRSKLMGQVNLVRLGQDYLTEGGSITLTTGILADDPVVKTASAAMVNGAVHSFVQAAALELPRGIRLNAVSSGVVEDAYEKYASYFPGHPPIAMQQMLYAYIRSVEGRGTGQVIRVYR